MICPACMLLSDFIHIMISINMVLWKLSKVSWGCIMIADVVFGRLNILDNIEHEINGIIAISHSELFT